MSIGENIRNIRKSKNMSQDELGRALGVSQAMIAQYESGKRKPKIGTLAKIAEALNVYIGKLDEDWGTDITNNPAEYEKFKNKMAEFESNLEKRIKHEEKALLDDYWKLNNIGRKEAKKRIQELTEIERYTVLED